MKGRIWLGWVALFFAWGFVVHRAALLLHEVGGHGVAATVVGRGFDGFNLTYFGGGSTRPTPGVHWTAIRRVILDWAGLVVQLGAGAVAMAFQRRPGLTPLARLLLALLATYFLLDGLGYATSGGFHKVSDPGFTADILDSHGLHVLAWLPPLVLYAAAALYEARAIVDAFREHFGSRSRLHLLVQSTTTLGAALLLHLAAIRVEATLRTNTVTSIAVKVEKLATVFPAIPTFPIRYVILAIGVGAFVLALARPVARAEGTQGWALPPVPRRYAVGVAGAALVCAVVITVLAHR
ncbi:MAG: hypothetical protein QM820_58100 [Minicystis sp.]